jgi:alanine racemase
LFLGDINTGTWPSWVGESSRIGIIIYGLESRGTQTLSGLRWRGPVATVNYRPVLSLERALQKNKHATAQRKFQGEGKIGHWSQMDI